MVRIKNVEEVGLGAGYKSTDLQYAATVGIYGAKLEIIANILDRLWKTPGLEFVDLNRALVDIDSTIKDIVIE